MMFGLFNAGRWAVALSAVVTLLVSPDEAAAQSSARVQQTFSAAAPMLLPPSTIQQTVASQQTVATLAPVAAAPTTENSLAQPAAPVQRTLKEMVDAFTDAGNQDEERLCLAKAV
jgi:hypothetical protein